MNSRKKEKNYIGYSIVFLYTILEWERCLEPQINFLDFYSENNFTKNLWISVFNALVEITEPVVSFDPGKFPFITDFTNEITSVSCEYERYNKYFWPVSYKLFDPTILEDECLDMKTSKYDYQFVKFYGILENTVKWFPVLNRLINKYPEVKTGFFSKIEGPLKIKTHRGPYRGLIRGHITIKNDTHESDTCNLTILNGAALKWQKGRAFVFDDTYYHRLDKTGNGTRISFIFDIQRKFKSENMNKMNELIIESLSCSDYVEEIREKL